ncbi:hypothetical protein OH77DRAFT_1593589, partial [Trametes cingulata]
MSTRDRKCKRCTGCRKDFTVSGYYQHLTQTSKPACIAVREAEIGAGLLDTDSEPGLSPSGHGSRATSPATSSEHRSSAATQHDQAGLSSDVDPKSSEAADEDAPPIPFEGDYFGEYAPEDFDDFDEFHEHAEDAQGRTDEGNQAAGMAEAEAAEEEDDAEYDADNHKYERGWEPPPRAMHLDTAEAAGEPVEEDTPDRAAQSRAHEHLRSKTFAVPFPGARAGAPTSQRRERSAYETFQRHIDSANRNPYAPFTSRIDWEVARWAKMRGPGSTAVSELLQIENLVSILGLSYTNSRELNAIVDSQLTSGRPRFRRREIIVAGEVFEIFYRDVIQCMRALYGDPELADLLVFTPERHYADADHNTRVYFDMHTGKWWWETQKELEKRKPGATIIPIIISSDKTQLTVFGSKTAYPVYMTIGNLPKDVRRKPSRRGQILLAYLPSTRLEHITNKAAWRRSLANLFHACMRLVLAPLKDVGVHGIDLVSGDGVTRRGHPIFAMYIGDYPEQLLVTCCKTGTCPKCPISRDELGEATVQNRPLRNLEEILSALDHIDEGMAAFSRACRHAGIKPVVDPFWRDLPYVNVFQSITPDILHQLYQGVIKHLLSWLKSAYGPEELDARCRRLPPNHQIRLFLKGITTLQKVTGKEHGDICRFLLGLVIGLPLPGGHSSVRLVRAVRGLLDFLYLARYPAHTADTLDLLRDALRRFHTNKDIFVQLGIRLHFKLPKLHSLDHYVDSIKLFGTTDNYDTQYTERLHIDFAKDAYRATNQKDEFPQMTLWLERREKILRHEAYVNWRLRHAVNVDADGDPTRERSLSGHPTAIPSTAPQQVSQVVVPGRPLPASATPWTRIKIAKWPSVKALSFDDAAERYGDAYLRDALARFVVQYRDPTLSAAEVEQESLNVTYHFRKIQAFHKLKFLLEDAQALGIMDDIQDVAHARPARRDKQGRPVPGRFDTVLVNDGTGGQSGVNGYHVAQL